jgi:hypothetical protein
MTPREASKAVKEELTRRGLPFTRVSARTVSFVDLARDSVVVVTVSGWKPNPVAAEILQFGRNHKICIDFKVIQPQEAPC